MWTSQASKSLCCYLARKRAPGQRDMRLLEKAILQMAHSTLQESAVPQILPCNSNFACM